MMRAVLPITGILPATVLLAPVAGPGTIDLGQDVVTTDRADGYHLTIPVGRHRTSRAGIGSSTR